MVKLGKWSKWSNTQMVQTVQMVQMGPRPWGPNGAGTKWAQMGPGPWALGPGTWALGPGPWALILALGPDPPGPWALGPGPWAQGPGPWAQGPKWKKAKSTCVRQKNPPGFRMARIDPSRQGVMTEASFVHGKTYFLP